MAPNWFFKKKIRRNSLGSGNMSHCKASSLYGHVDHYFVLFKEIQQSFLTRKSRLKKQIQHFEDQCFREFFRIWCVWGCKSRQESSYSCRRSAQVRNGHQRSGRSAGGRDKRWMGRWERREWRTQRRRETLITCVDERTCATPLSHAVQCESWRHETD